MEVSKKDGLEQFLLWCVFITIFIGGFIISLSFDFFLSVHGFTFHYNAWKSNLLNQFLIYLSLFSFIYFPNLSVYDIFLFLCRILFTSFYCRYCDLWDLVFVHLFFMFSYPYFLICDINVFFHGILDHASTIIIYVSIVMTFVTFNVTWDHIDRKSVV